MSGPRVEVLGSVLEFASTLREKFDPGVNPVMVALVSLAVAVTEPLSSPSICW